MLAKSSLPRSSPRLHRFDRMSIIGTKRDQLVLMELGINHERRGDRQCTQRVRQRTGDADHVVVALREELLGDARTCLADVSNDGAVSILHVELTVPTTIF